MSAGIRKAICIRTIFNTTQGNLYLKKFRIYDFEASLYEDCFYVEDENHIKYGRISLLKKTFEEYLLELK